MNAQKRGGDLVCREKEWDRMCRGRWRVWLGLDFSQSRGMGEMLREGILCLRRKGKDWIIFITHNSDSSLVKWKDLKVQMLL